MLELTFFVFLNIVYKNFSCGWDGGIICCQESVKRENLLNDSGAETSCDHYHV